MSGSGGEAQLVAVKEYIAKHNLEDELSNAVNQAIKLDSDDPYRVISDYLRKFAKVRGPARSARRQRRRRKRKELQPRSFSLTSALPSRARRSKTRTRRTTMT